METQQIQDLEDLQKSLDLAKKYFSINNPVHIKDKIGFELVAESLNVVVKSEGQADWSHYCFDYSELYEAVYGDEVESDKANKWYGTHRSKLEELFAANSSLNRFIVERNAKPLYLAKIESKGKRRSRLRLVTAAYESSVNTGSNLVCFAVTSLPKPMPWAKPFLNLVLSKQKILTIIVPIMIFLYLIMLNTVGIISLPGKATSAVLATIAIPGVWLFYKFHELLTKGITSAPRLWSKSFHKNTLLTLKGSGNSHSPLAMRSVTIEGKCAECGEDLLIEKSREFEGRYIAKCRIAPTEHLFSFDHVKKTGKPLR